jgi:TolB protein
MRRLQYQRLLICAVAVAVSISAHADSGSPSVSPDGSRIAFTSSRDGGVDINLIGADGTGEIHLTKTPESEDQFGWSRDGKEIWYSVFDKDVSRLYTIRPDDSPPKQIGSFPGRAVQLSPNGKRVLYSQGTWTEVRLMESALDGSDVHQLTDGKSVVWSPRWSADGKWIAWTTRDSAGQLNIWMMRNDGSRRRQVTHLTPQDGRAQMPAWSRDGRKLAVQANDLEKGSSFIWIIDVARGAATRIGSHETRYLDEIPSWFPDGKRIAVQSNRSGRMEIWVLNTDGTVARQLTH